MITTKSFCTAKMWSETNLSLAIERARPSAALNSSTHPYASTRGSAFDNRRPYISDVSPLSPVLVTMDTKPNCRAFDSLAPARSPVRASFYIARLRGLHSVKRQFMKRRLTQERYKLQG